MRSEDNKKDFSVIIVDENTDFTESLKVLLGYEVIDKSIDITTCTTAEQALAHTKNHRAGFMISDVILPKKNGLVLAEELMSSAPHYKIIFITGYPLWKVSNDRNTPILAKPLNDKTYNYLVSSIVEHYQQTLQKDTDNALTHATRPSATSPDKGPFRHPSVPLLQS